MPVRPHRRCPRRIYGRRMGKIAIYEANEAEYRTKSPVLTMLN